MKAVVITQPGGPEMLQIAERPVPLPEAGQVLIKVMAAGLNFPDIAQRKGCYPAPGQAGVPADIPGLEVAGIIEATGDASRRWKPGDRVCALASGGGYAEYCCIPEGQCLPIPKGLSFTEAAALPETFFTVWSNVFDRGNLKKGDNFLVHGGSGGIGVAAIQMARAWGCRVFTTAGTDEKCRFCEELGASGAVNYKTEDFETAIQGQFSEPGIQVILDIIGGAYTAKNLRLLAQEGSLVQINAMGGREASIDLVEVMRRRLVITGSMLRGRDSSFKNAIALQLEKHFWPLLENGTIHPVIYAVFPLEEAAEAHRLMESSRHMGKIVLENRNA